MAHGPPRRASPRGAVRPARQAFDLTRVPSGRSSGKPPAACVKLPLLARRRETRASPPKSNGAGARCQPRAALPSTGAGPALTRGDKACLGILLRNVQQTTALICCSMMVCRRYAHRPRRHWKNPFGLAAGTTGGFDEQHYERLLLARPVLRMGKAVGYLPGTRGETPAAWMQPIFYELKFLLADRRVQAQVGWPCRLGSRRAGRRTNGPRICVAGTLRRVPLTDWPGLIQNDAAWSWRRRGRGPNRDWRGRTSPVQRRARPGGLFCS